MNGAARYIGLQVPFQIRVFPRRRPRNGIAGSCGNLIFSCLRNHHIVLHRGGTTVIPTNSESECPFLSATPAFTLFNLFYFFGCTHGIWKFLGQGWNLSHRCALCHSCNHAGSLPTVPGLRLTQVASRDRSWIMNPLRHSGNSMPVF